MVVVALIVFYFAIGEEPHERRNVDNIGGTGIVNGWSISRRYSRVRSIYDVSSY